MVCLYCSGHTKVTNSRVRRRGLHVWRRRSCQACKAVFTTQEGMLGEHSLVVQKGQRYEPFLRDKLLISLHGSLKHRKKAVRDATGLTDTVVIKLLPYATNGAIPSREIRRQTTETLKNFDEVAALHYQAFHRS